MEQYIIDHYDIRYNTENLDEKQDQNIAQIICYSGDAFVARICFWKDKVPPNCYKEEGISQILHINFHIDRFDDVIQMFRYEKSILIDYDKSKKLGGLLLKDLRMYL